MFGRPIMTDKNTTNTEGHGNPDTFPVLPLRDVIRGVLRVEYPDHDELISAGDAYYVAPGHLALHLVDTTLVDFGPTAPTGPTSPAGDPP
jgi:hypothetical protein